jgi:hypothetical protein
MPATWHSATSYNMWLYLTFFLFSTWKFMFTPMAGPAAGLTFLETLIPCLLGGYFSATIFYFGSSYFMRIHQKRMSRKRMYYQNLGIPNHKRIRNFTKINRTVIRIKRSFGKWPVCWLFPLFLSIPLGTIITAKFYKHHKNTFQWILLGVSINGIFITSATYAIQIFVK